MFYVLIGEIKPGTLAQRNAARPAHLARLNSLLDQGRLLLAGPCPAIDSATPGDAGFTDSVIVAEFDSLAMARTWADADPYVAAGVYENVVIKPFIKVLP